MEWKPAVRNEDGSVTIPKRWLHIHYYEAMNILFRFENSLRVFVYAILKNEHLDKWRDCSFIIGGENGSIKGIAAKRVNQAENFGYLGFDIKASLMHLTSGELIELVMSEAYWPKFKSYFKGQRDIIKNKLQEIGTIRNSFAHFRPMKADDIELIKQNARHTLLSVEECLQNIFSQPLRVPTNTTDEWYKSMSTLGSSQVKTMPYFSANESWVNVKLRFQTPLLTKQTYGSDFWAFDVAKINSANILLHHQVLAKYVTHLSEEVGYPTHTSEADMEVNKDLNFVFRKDVLVANHQEIAEAFREVLNAINQECALLKDDNLARGSIVESAKVYSWQSKQQDGSTRLEHRVAVLSQAYLPSHPDEYWGQHRGHADVVAGLQRYPWMPEDISAVEGFGE